MTQDVAAIARGLTKAQREAFPRSTEMGCVTRSVATAKAFIRQGIATCEFEFQPKTLDWTPLGLALRTHLLSQDTGA